MSAAAGDVPTCHLRTAAQPHPALGDFLGLGPEPQVTTAP
ncbi:hypothetical protein QF037_001052 [Streptomyces canus]|nr:hypothetical protein [Streptomyces canus]